jgi:TonB family protein
MPKRLFPVFALLVNLCLSATAAPPENRPPAAIAHLKFGAEIIPVYADNSVRYDKGEVPVYPYELKKHGIEGSATIVAIIDKKGNPLEVGLVSTEGDPGFGPPTVSAAKKWKYYPMQNEKGELGTYAIKITIKFHLEEG